eukprot:CAMPEP_0118907236 /NCGR_PEP_ID=MMETSP1166-20130328/10782_1 /TAXON_ID=1104430 /ORGANISM="Chrysoreinhardia sp, Strain CCMP3193" /LENGTH=96 /DNA_ID=CAMNT_0006846599 /DNA_START=162 /DNA_END=449 /DNA_ORIENTATION=+
MHDEEELETENIFDAYAVVGAVLPLEPTEETVAMWQDRATDVVDVTLVRDDEELPEGYVALRRTPAGNCAALRGGDDDDRLYVCFKRRGRLRQTRE